MIKITIENTLTGEKNIAEVDAFVLATMENIGSSKESIYTSIGNISGVSVDIEEMLGAILDRAIEEDCVDIIGEDEECCCNCPCNC